MCLYYKSFSQIDIVSHCFYSLRRLKKKMIVELLFFFNEVKKIECAFFRVQTSIKTNKIHNSELRIQANSDETKINVFCLAAGLVCERTCERMWVSMFRMIKLKRNEIRKQKTKFKQKKKSCFVFVH